MTEIELTFAADTVSLRGTLAAVGSNPGPAALLVSGSGPIDRDSNMKRMSIDVMRQVAVALAANDISTLRYDKRGVGESGGDYLSCGFADNVDDARAALDALLARPEIDADRVVVIGHSEGALIASVLADDERLAGVVLLAGAATNGHEVLTWQARQIAPTLPRPARALMALFRQDLVRIQAKRLARIAASTDDVIRIQGVRVNAKWLRQFMAFDPADALRRARVPVLAVTGAKDVQVDPADVARMGAAVPTSFDGHVLDDLTHLLRADSGPPGLRTYKKQTRRPVEPKLLELIAGWVGARTDRLNGVPHDEL